MRSYAPMNLLPKVPLLQGFFIASKSSQLTPSDQLPSIPGTKYCSNLLIKLNCALRNTTLLLTLLINSSYKASSIHNVRRATQSLSRKGQRLIPAFRKSSMELQMQMLLWRLPKKQAFQLPQKIFNQCRLKNCQTRSWKKQLAGCRGVRGRGAGEGASCGNHTLSKRLH